MKLYLILMILFSMAYAGVYWTATNEVRRYIGPRFYASYAATLLFGYFAPSLQAFQLVIFVLFVATVRDRVDAVCRYVLLMLLLPDRAWQVRVGGAYFFDLSIMMVIAAAAAVSILVHPGPRATRIRRLSIEDLFVGVLVLIYWIGVTRFPSATVFLKAGLTQIFAFVLPYVVLRANMRTLNDLRLVTAMLAVGGVILAFLAIYETRAGWMLFSPLTSRIEVNQTIFSMAMFRGGALRAAVTSAGPLPLACLLVVSVLAVMASRSFVRSRNAWFGWVGVTLIGLLMTQSRGNTACLFVGIIIFLLLRRKSASATAIAAAAGGVGAALWLLAQSSPRIASFLGIESQYAGHYDYRNLLLERGLEEAIKNPVLGADILTVMARLADIRQGQQIIDFVNTYLYIFLVSGLIGLGAFLLVSLCVLQKVMMGFRGLRDEQMIRLRAFGAAAFIVILVQISFMSLIDRVPFILVASLAMLRMVHVLHRRARAAARRSGSLSPAPSRNDRLRPASHPQHFLASEAVEPPRP